MRGLGPQSTKLLNCNQILDHVADQDYLVIVDSTGICGIFARYKSELMKIIRLISFYSTISQTINGILRTIKINELLHFMDFIVSITVRNLERIV